MVARLCDRNPVISPDALVDEMVPPSTFDHVSFDSYIPDPNEPSQAQAVAKARDFVAREIAPNMAEWERDGELPRDLQLTDDERAIAGTAALALAEWSV